MNCLNCIDHGIWEKDKLIIPCLNCAEINRRKFNLQSLQGAKFRKLHDIEEYLKAKYWVSYKINRQPLEDIRKNLSKLELSYFNKLCLKYKNHNMKTEIKNNILYFY